MSYAITSTEHATFRGVPLDTPAWSCTDLSVLWSGPADYRGGDITIPFSRGVRAGRRITPERRVLIPLVVYGNADAEGAPYADARTGLRANVDALTALMRPGAGTLELHLPDGSVRSTTALPVGGLQAAPLGPGAMRVIIDLLIPGGVWFGATDESVESEVVAADDTETLSVPHPGTADQDSAIYELSGTATSVVLTNATHPDAPTLTITVDLSDGDVVIDAGAFSATQGSTNVVGAITATATPTWLPLVPGTNVLTIEPVGGTCTLTATHTPTYL
jgi:hypothetical protein